MPPISATPLQNGYGALADRNAIEAGNSGAKIGLNLLLVIADALTTATTSARLEHVSRGELEGLFAMLVTDAADEERLDLSISILAIADVPLDRHDARSS